MNILEKAEKFTVKQLLAIVAALQTCVLIALVFVSVWSYRAADWSKGAMMGEFTLASAIRDAASDTGEIKDRFDDDGAVKCRAP